MANFAPMAGKFARLTLNTTILKGFSEWDLRARADDIDTSHFESATDAAGRVYAEGICGLVEAEITGRGAYDRNMPPDTIVGIFPDTNTQVPCFLGLNKLFGYSCQLRFLSTPVTVRLRDKAGFEWQAKNNGLITLPA